jgi:hypothetical protein
MKRILTALLLTFATAVAAPAPYPATINSRAQTAPPLLVFRANESRFELTFTDGPTASDITGQTPFLNWYPVAGSSSNSPATIESTQATNGVVVFNFSPSSVNYAPGRYFYEAGVLAEGGARTYRQGDFLIRSSPVGTDATAVVFSSTNINWGLVGLYTGTADYGPYQFLDGFATTTNGAGRMLITSTAGTPAWGSITGKPFTNISDIAHSDLDALDWTESGHTGTAGRVAYFGEGGAAGYAPAGAGITFANDDIAVSNSIIEGAALGASAYQPAGDFDYAWITNPPALFTPTDLPTDYGSDWTTLTSSIAGKQDAGSYVETNDAAYLAALTNLTAGAGIEITGTGRERTVASTITQYEDSDAVAAIKADGDWNAGEWDTAWQNPASATNWTYTSDGSEITLTGYATNAPNAVVIPDILDGLPVTGFNETFILYTPDYNGNHNITSVSGGANIRHVPPETFFEAFSLTNVSFSSSVLSVGEGAFSSCAALVSVFFAGDKPSEGVSIFDGIPANQVTVYVTNPTATGWGATFGGMPVVRMPIAADSGTIAATATTGTEIVNYQTATGIVANALTPYVQTNHTGNVSITGMFTAGSYDPSTTPYALTSAPTTTLTRTYGNTLALTPTNSVVITADTSYSTNDTHTLVLGVDLRGTSHTLTFDTNTIYGAESVGFTVTNKLYSFSLHKGWKQTRFEILKGGDQ